MATNWKKRNKILVCDQRNYFTRTIKELEKVLEETSEGEGFKIFKLSEFKDPKKTKEERKEIWDEVRVVCFHTETQDNHLIKEAFSSGIPVILVRRGQKSTESFESYCAIVKDHCDLNDEKIVDKILYKFSNKSEIRGAFKWVNTFYPALMDEREQKEKEIRNIITGK